MNIKIVKAKITDLEWINETYKKIDFLPSTLKNEVIAIAHGEENKIGLGRVAVIDKDSCELGGMYVNPTYRGKGIARKIVEFLIDNAQRPLIYCIPFKHLESFYGSFGFKAIKVDSSTPKKIVEKLKFCEETYDEDTMLMRMHK